MYEPISLIKHDDVRHKRILEERKRQREEEERQREEEERQR